ncbi:MAG: hypothetical protein QOG68_2727 [Solirubrobacteraceae bacterium]|nr:hypothetical protein [Solirubrobacteraceae bacterium]
MPSSALIRITSATALSVLAFCAPAFADNTATVETGGPGNTEYAIPLQSARQDAAGGSSKGAHKGQSKAPLFGVGVKSSQPAAGTATTTTPAAATTTHSKPRSKRSGHKRRTKASRHRKNRSAPVILPTAAPASAPAGNGSTSATIGGLAVAVLLLGGVLGSIARRRRVP